MKYNIRPVDLEDDIFPAWLPWNDNWMTFAEIPDGLSISENDDNLYVEAPLPGVDLNDTDVSFNGKRLWIKGSVKEEENTRKYHQKSKSEFSYALSIPKDIDSKVEPRAEYRNGVMTVIFKKAEAVKPKKLTVTATE